MFYSNDNICNVKDAVTATCPFHNRAVDKSYIGSPINQMRFSANSNYCLGLDVANERVSVDPCTSKTTAWVVDDFLNRCGALDTVNVYVTSTGSYGGSAVLASCAGGYGGYNQWGQVFK
jgi:uncharacterized protein (UPF0210 family)